MVNAKIEQMIYDSSEIILKQELTFELNTVT